MRIIQLIFLAVLLVMPHGAIAADNAQTRVRALLVIASSQKGESDARLSAYEPTMRRVLRFESYRLVGEGSANLASPGKASVNLGRGHSLALETPKSEGGGAVRLQVTWQEGSRSLMNMGLVLLPGKPAVLGGPSSGKEGEVWAVILVAE
jgi:hypothetical protein